MNGKTIFQLNEVYKLPLNGREIKKQFQEYIKHSKEHDEANCWWFHLSAKEKVDIYKRGGS